MTHRTATVTKKKVEAPPPNGLLRRARMRADLDRGTPAHVESETSLGHDFSQVPAHTNLPAVRAPEQSGPCPVFPRTCPLGGACHIRPTPAQVQTKLKVNQPGDKYEQEADRVAEQVMRMSDPRTHDSATVVTGQAQGPYVKRLCPECDEEIRRQPMEEGEEEEIFQAKEAPGRNPEGHPDVQVHLNATRGSGRSLPKSVRAFFEPRFGYDFSQVRMHTGGRAADSACALNARAFTLGKDIVFGGGRYSPDTMNGRRLLAHELTHVVQQTGSDSSRMGLSERVTLTAENRVMRMPYPGCTSAVTGVSDPDRVIDSARAGATTRTTTALSALRTPRSQTLRQLDRHFHCPSISNIREIITTLRQIQANLPSHPVSCISGPTDCRPGIPSRMSSGVAQELCPRFFGSSTDEQVAQLIAGAAFAVGRTMKCVIRDPCYDDFTQPASTFVNNSYSYAYFALEASGFSGLPKPAVLPCRPLNTGFNVVVPPDAATTPRSIRPLSGFEEIPAGSVILPVFVDRGGKYFIYHEGLPGGQVYMPGEKERFYLPEGLLFR